MSRLEKIGRKYKYRVKQKYQEDPFAFLVLWSLFFSAIFLIFAFRGLIASSFMHKIDTSDEVLQNDITNTADNAIDNSVNAVDNQTNSSVDNTSIPVNNTVDNSVVDNSPTNEIQNTTQ